MTEFAVIREQLEPVNTNLVREILARAGGMPKIDAAQTARRQQGILGENFSAKQAQAMVDAFGDMGWKFRILPTLQIQKLPPAKTISWIEMNREGINVPLNYQGESVPIPWPSIFVVSAGHVSEVEEHRHEIQKTKQVYVPGVVNVSVQVSEDEVIRNSRKTHITELIGIDGNGDFTYVRFTPAKFRFDRVQPPIPPGSTHQRYLQIVEALTKNATQAVISHETQEILDRQVRGNSLSSGDYKAMSETQAFRERNRWLLQVAVLREMERN